MGHVSEARGSQVSASYTFYARFPQHARCLSSPILRRAPPDRNR